MEMSLCSRCRSDFEDAGKELRRNKKVQYGIEECDFCGRPHAIRYFTKDKDEDIYKKEIPDYIRQHYPHVIDGAK